MVKSPQILAIVPARGGSRSIPHKNIKLLNGIPLIAYSIAASLQAKTIDRVIVSTDDPEIADIARQWGAEVPFLRPAELAKDDTPDLPVFQHALQWLAEQQGYIPKAVIQLRPTTPIRPPDCVDRAVAALLGNEQVDSVRGVVPSKQNPFKMWRFQDNGYMRPLLDTEFEEPYNMPRQKLPATYWQTGHIDAIRYATIMTQNSMTGQLIWPLVLDARYTIDIDVEQDWKQAEWMLKRLTLPFVRPVAESSPLLDDIRLLVLDFDGVLTDNRVWVDQDGTEAVWCHRGDGWGIARLKEAGVEIVVLSTETNPVVAARCRKLKIECIQGCNDKLSALQNMAQKRSLKPEHIAYVGNDVNDLTCIRWVGISIAVADAVSEVKKASRLVTTCVGGRGAVREVADWILSARP